MLNTLANHGFLPHSGENITKEDTVYALHTALNINQSAAAFLFNKAITTNPLYPNASNFSLIDLRRHNILEHDASLSRGDYYFGNDYSFNQTIFDETKSYWTTPIIDVKQAASARLARVHTSNTTNPTFSLTQTGIKFSFGETSAYIIVLGDRTTGTVRRAWVEYLFGKYLTYCQRRRCRDVESDEMLQQRMNVCRLLWVGLDATRRSRYRI